MADRFKDKAEGDVDKAKDHGRESGGDPLDDQTKRAQGTIDQDEGDARQDEAGGKSNVEDAFDKIKDK